MHNESYTSVTTAKPTKQGVLVLTGYGIRVAVERGYLTVADGRGRERREGRFPRTTRGLKRLVVIGHTGTVSFNALRWLSDIGCAFVQIDTGGDVIAASSAAGLDDARLRRAQALAAGNGTGVEIARDLMSAKLKGQAAVLDRFEQAEREAADIRRWRDRLASASTLDAIRTCEAQAAASYWNAWAAVPVRFARKAVARVPHHWQTFGARSSLLTSSPRTASNPANAMLNYLYAIAEAETRIALLAVGLDPGLGVVHADQKNRDSFACDVMEAIRPNIDAYVLELTQSRPFGTGDFFETRQGSCRLMPPVTRMLAETAPRWAAALAPIVEGIAQTLMHAGASSRSTTAQRRLPTPLTQSNRSAGRANVRKRRAHDTSSDASRARTARLPRACLDCGTILDNPTRRYCDDCLPEIRQEQGTAFALAGPAALAARRVAGNDPAHGGDAGKARGRRNASHHHANSAWNHDTTYGQDSEYFSREILPMLQTVSLRVMADATNLTPGYCSFVRRGLKVPHRRHWSALERLTTSTTNEKGGRIERG